MYGILFTSIEKHILKFSIVVHIIFGKEWLQKVNQWKLVFVF